MDFYQIRVKEIEKGPRKGEMDVYPDWKVGRSKDLMVRGGKFYAVWDEEAKLWSQDEYDVQRLVDADLRAFASKKEAATGIPHSVRDLHSFSSNSWRQFRQFMQNISDNSTQLDQELTFANTEVKKSDYVSRKLPYILQHGDISAWDELVGVLYSVEERAKIEWFIGAIISGDSKKIQKFMVLYGPPASGKSTILNIFFKLFGPYASTFDAKALGSNNQAFATEVFKSNPLVAIQHDGDLSRIEDNARLNSIIAHEEMTLNEKYKASYTAKILAVLVMGTNQPVKISDAKSGIIRRLIDVNPTGVKIPTNHYHALLSKIDFELGAIAQHCLDVYLNMGKNYYNNYRPTEMMLQTDVFFNFIESVFDVFKAQDSTTLKQSYGLYKEYCSETGIERPLPQYKIREELRNYFDEFYERKEVQGTVVRSYYEGFNANKFKAPTKDVHSFSLVIEEDASLLDEYLADMPAQGWKLDEFGGKIPSMTWKRCKTTLKDIDTNDLHFVKVPENHIVIDFDLKDETGEKSLERNLEAASTWPPTYAELSQGGGGVHLHYLYEGDVSELSSVYSDGIEVKTLLGDASLRRRLTKCNSVPIATLTKGHLPIKEKKVLSDQIIKSEKGLRDMIARNLKKEFHAGTKPSIDFIKHILDEAYESGMAYDVSDLRSRIMTFANNSSNQPLQSLKVVQGMHFRSEALESSVDDFGDDPYDVRDVAVLSKTEQERAVIEAGFKADKVVLFDVEVYPNLFVICWKYEDSPTIVRMVNPTAQEVEALFKMKLVGYNCRRYDNHILYGRYMGYDNEQLYRLSKKIMEKQNSAMFGEAYNLSYADIYDFAAVKQSLKRWQFELGIRHEEMDIPWDEPVPDDMIDKVVEYCCNDVNSTEAVWKHLKQDFVARQILADLSGLSVNDTTQKHTGKIIFGNDRQPQRSFIYTDLSKQFPGYKFEGGKSTYRGEDPSEGGYVYSEPGIYEDVAVFDVASMHPTSIEVLNLFGEYTGNFSALKAARIAIKRKDYDAAKQMLNGKLAPYLENPEDAKKLSYALKIVINIVYGLTSAKFDNLFRDNRNADNIVAKRGALFMIDLKLACQERGMKVVHIKTDSIKIANATPGDWEFVKSFGAGYGYEFEHEETFDKFCLVNDAVYIAKIGWHAEDPSKVGTWEAVGAQFQHPYVFKSLFSGEDIEFDDLCELKQVQKGTMYLDFEHDRATALVEGMQFVGRTGVFVPVTERSNGGVLYRVVDDKLHAVQGTKGHLWLEADKVAAVKLSGGSVEIDMGYFEKLSENAIKTIEKFGSFEAFAN